VGEVDGIRPRILAPHACSAEDPHSSSLARDVGGAPRDRECER
jgi:hypothetical protein